MGGVLPTMLVGAARHSTSACVGFVIFKCYVPAFVTLIGLVRHAVFMTVSSGFTKSSYWRYSALYYPNVTPTDIP